MDKKVIEKWLEISSGCGDGSGFGSGYGNGYGCGNGYGFGSGSGYSFGYGYGSGNGSGDGSSDGSSDGSGDGCGHGCGDGSGDGDGYGYGIKYFNRERVWKIDGVNTIITSIHGNIAKGFIINRDFSLEKTYIAKGHNRFAHGETIEQAMQNLEEKIFDAIDIEVKIDAFKKKFDKNAKYSGHDFFTWHHNLTGSCLQGRNNFVKNNGINLDDKFTVKEFLEIVKGSYGWSVLEKLVKEYE